MSCCNTSAFRNVHFLIDLLEKKYALPSALPHFNHFLFDTHTLHYCNTLFFCLFRRHVSTNSNQCFYSELLPFQIMSINKKTIFVESGRNIGSYSPFLRSRTTGEWSKKGQESMLWPSPATVACISPKHALDFRAEIVMTHTRALERCW